MGNTDNRKKFTTSELVLCGLFSAMTFIFTWLINIRLPLIGTGGLIHLGNVPLFIGAMLFGRRVGAISGAVGMGLFDLLSGWTAWAPFTFIIVGCMGFVIGTVSEKKLFKNNYINCSFAIALALIIKIVGYYFTEVILIHNWIVPLSSIPGNIVQVVLAGIITVVIVPQLRKISRKMRRV